MQLVALASARNGSGPDAYGSADRRFEMSAVQAVRATLLVLVVGNVGRIPILDLGHRSAPLLVNDIAVMAAIGIGVMAMAQARSVKLNDVAIAGIVFAGIGGLSAIAGIQRFGFSALEVVGSLAYLARWCTYFALYVVMINCVRPRDVERVWGALEWAMIAIVAFGIVQAIFLPNFAFIVYPEARESYDWDSQRHRLVSTILEPNIASGMIVITLLMQLARLASGVVIPLWKPLLMFAGLVATLSRGGMLSFVLGMGVVFLARGLSRRIMRFGVAVLVLLLAASPGLVEFAGQYNRFSISDASAMGRVIVWQRAIATFLEHPWFGIGFNTYGFVQERRGFERVGGSSYSAEGGLLFVAVMTGIIGLLVYLAMLWFVLRRAKRAWRHPAASPGERGLLIGTAAATVAILIHSLFVNSLLTPWVFEPLLVVWALSFIVASDLRTRAVAPPP